MLSGVSLHRAWQLQNDPDSNFRLLFSTNEKGRDFTPASYWFYWKRRTDLSAFNLESISYRPYLNKPHNPPSKFPALFNLSFPLKRATGVILPFLRHATIRP